MNGEIKFNKRRTIYLANLVLVCLIALLLCACTSTGKNETTNINNVTDQVAKKDNSDAGKTGKDQEIVCRERIITGSLFKKKLCATKAVWAERDSKKKQEVDRLTRDIEDKTSLNPGSANPMGAGATAGSMPGM